MESQASLIDPLFIKLLQYRAILWTQSPQLLASIPLQTTAVSAIMNHHQRPLRKRQITGHEMNTIHVHDVVHSKWKRLMKEVRVLVCAIIVINVLRSMISRQEQCQCQAS